MDNFIEQINRMEVKCPVHDQAMTGKRHEIKTGIHGVVRRIMYVGICNAPKCMKWFEFLPPDGVLWP